MSLLNKQGLNRGRIEKLLMMSLPNVDEPHVPPIASEVQKEEHVKEKEGIKEQTAKTSSVLPVSAADEIPPEPTQITTIITIDEITAKVENADVEKSSMENKGKALMEADPPCPPPA
ncbi:hypothetical protein Dimus_024401 [Dionaea muscipula]